MANVLRLARPARMEIIRGLHNLRDHHRGCVATIGNFDGVHRGHQALIGRTRTMAERHGVPAVVMSFEPTPRDYFAGEDAPPRVLTLRDKAAALARYGIDRLLLVRFDRRLASIAPEAFIDEVLRRMLGIRGLVIGDDFRFGHMRRGDLALLAARAPDCGFELDAVASVVVDGERCSSSLLRERLAVPALDAVERMLGRAYEISGVVRPGLRLGRQLAMPTANIGLRRQMALHHGIYAVVAQVEGRRWPGVANFGVRPTLGLSRCLLETHIFGDCGDLYGRMLDVEFKAFLRSEQRFASLDALKLQMHADAAQARSLLGIAS
jgi:riboflavin kinase/FMN adenylyltransferase